MYRLITKRTREPTDRSCDNQERRDATQRLHRQLNAVMRVVDLVDVLPTPVVSVVKRQGRATRSTVRRSAARRSQSPSRVSSR